MPKTLAFASVMLTTHLARSSRKNPNSLRHQVVLFTSRAIGTEPFLYDDFIVIFQCGLLWTRLAFLSTPSLETVFRHSLLVEEVWTVAMGRSSFVVRQPKTFLYFPMAQNQTSSQCVLECDYALSPSKLVQSECASAYCIFIRTETHKNQKRIKSTLDVFACAEGLDFTCVLFFRCGIDFSIKYLVMMKQKAMRRQEHKSTICFCERIWVVWLRFYSHLCSALCISNTVRNLLSCTLFPVPLYEYGEPCILYKYGMEKTN